MYITEKHMNHTFHAWSINTFCKVNNYVWIILIYKKTIFAKYSNKSNKGFPAHVMRKCKPLKIRGGGLTESKFHLQ